MQLWPIPAEEDALLCPGTNRAIQSLYSAVAVGVIKRGDGAGAGSSSDADAVAVRLNVSCRAADDSGWLQPAAALVWTTVTVLV